MSGEDTPLSWLSASAYGAAQLDVAFDTGQDSTCTYDDHLEENEMAAFVSLWKGKTSTSDYWCVFICGAHDAPACADNDPDAEPAACGASYNHEYGWVFNETIEDACAESGWTVSTVKKRVAVHETGHQFRRADEAVACLMNGEVGDMTSAFCNACATAIGTGTHPGP